VLIDFLRANADMFAWSPSDMPSIPREVAEHSLEIRADSKPVKQRLRRFEAVLPTDLEYGSPRLKAYNEQTNKETRENAVDRLKEDRDMALLNSARYQ